MISCKLAGGLGNYLFQIAAAHALSLRNNDVTIFDDRHVVSPHKTINTYKSNILRNLNYGIFTPEKSYGEPFFHFQEISYHRNLLLMGYFQSEKYFQDYKEEIRKLFSIDEKSMIYINEKYQHLNFSKSTSLHVRRGDYLFYPTKHPTCSLDYYKKALKIIDSENILIFSDDIEWCKKNLSIEDKKVFYITDNSDYIDLWLMSLCKNNITANSSFSWWGSWLNLHKDKKVIAPSTWFGTSLQHNTKDLYSYKTIII